MTKDTVSFTADGPNALSHIRRVLAGYDLDDDADGVDHIEVKVRLAGGERAESDEATPEQEPEGAAKDNTPGRIRANTRHHRALYALAVMENEGETPATPKAVAEHVSEHSGYGEMSSKDASSALGRVAERGLCNRERPGHSFIYEMNDAGRLELQRLGVPDVFEEGSYGRD